MKYNITKTVPKSFPKAENRHALTTMIRQLESNPEKVMAAQVTDAAVGTVHIGRIDLDFLSGKQSEKVVMSL